MQNHRIAVDMVMIVILCRQRSCKHADGDSSEYDEHDDDDVLDNEHGDGDDGDHDDGDDVDVDIEAVATVAAEHTTWLIIVSLCLLQRTLFEPYTTL